MEGKPPPHPTSVPYPYMSLYRFIFPQNNRFERSTGGGKEEIEGRMWDI